MKMQTYIIFLISYCTLYIHVTVYYVAVMFANINIKIQIYIAAMYALVYGDYNSCIQLYTQHLYICIKYSVFIIIIMVLTDAD